jgi:fatty acid desaturase
MNTILDLKCQTPSARGEIEDYRDDTKAIRRAIRDADRRMRERWPVLRHQTALGMGFVALGYTTAAVSALLFINGLIPAWACVAINAMAFAALREIEHDLIHNLYFKNRLTLQNIVLFLIWPALGNVPSPLYRRKIHLQHHRSSGHEADLEERFIGNGNGFGLLRWLTMIDTGLSCIFRQRELEKIPGFNMSEFLRSLVPVNVIFYFMWLSFLGYHGATFLVSLLGFDLELPARLTPVASVLNFVAVIWVLPNVIRQASLQVLTSSMHYYGDVESTFQETQILSKWYWLPLQLFSCNFGNSHAIHHFYVAQPFYLRELVRREAHAVMRSHGVRFDDLGTFGRANRWASVGSAVGSVPKARDDRLLSRSLSRPSPVAGAA